MSKKLEKKMETFTRNMESIFLRIKTGKSKFENKY